MGVYSYMNRQDAAARLEPSSVGLPTSLSAAPAVRPARALTPQALSGLNLNQDRKPRSAALVCGYE